MKKFLDKLKTKFSKKQSSNTSLSKTLDPWAKKIPIIKSISKKLKLEPGVTLTAIIFISIIFTLMFSGPKLPSVLIILVFPVLKTI